MELSRAGLLSRGAVPVAGAQARDHLSPAHAWAGLRECRGRSSESRSLPGTLSSFHTAIRTSWETVAMSSRGTMARFLQEILSQGLKLVRMGGGGEITRFICGYLVCDPQLSKAFLGGLPPIFKVNIGNDSSGQWLENSIRYSVGQAVASQAGSEIVVAKLSEALFAETLRRYVDLLPPGQTGWLAGARDPDVGNALALVHRQPSDPWTIAELARRVGVSRSVLAERFRHFLGVPPMAYLTRWRLQLGAQLLTSTSHSVVQIAAEVGYESEPAFNRAFKREFGSPPARFRMKSKVAAAH